MRKAKLLLVVLGLALAFGTLAHAAVVDVVQFPTGFFVPDETQTYNSPYYRWWDEDWGWTHNAIGGSPTSATLNISAWDVDTGGIDPEVDNIYARDGGVWTLLGSLNGLDNSWGYTTFTLSADFYDDIASGLQVKMDIDSTHTYDYWAVTLAKSALNIDGGQLPGPNPGNPIPEPGSMMLLGTGLLGMIGYGKVRFGKKA